ncbi:secreted protein, partial [Candidatus Omnitrophus magneticus]
MDSRLRGNDRRGGGNDRWGKLPKLLTLLVIAFAGLFCVTPILANAANDLNGDGYPDIVFSNELNGTNRNINSYIYWGASTGPYSTKTELPTSGGTTSSIIDLNNDGYLDIVFSNVYNGTSYNINSYIYWGASAGPYSTKTDLATSG